MLAAVGAATGRRWSPAELARTAYQVERIDLKIEGGMQDQYAAAYGGLYFIEFAGDDEVESARWWSPASRWRSWSARCCSPGRGTAASTTASCAARSTGCSARTQPRQPGGAQGAGRGDARRALLGGDLATFAEGHPGLGAQAPMATGIATPRLEELYEVGRAAGAKAGGKVLGAGGAGSCCSRGRRSGGRGWWPARSRRCPLLAGLLRPADAHAARRRARR